MPKVDKLLYKAKNTPQNLRFKEFCNLIEFFEANLRNTKGSHFIYKRSKEPSFAISVQDVGGKAKPYQVREFLNILYRLRILKEEGE